jgi:hypothetical protein
MGGLKVSQPGGRSKQQAPSIWLRIGFWGCIGVGVAVVFRRVLVLAALPRSAPAQLTSLDAVFASYSALTSAHILPALAFVLVAPLVVFRRPADAAWPERLIYPLGAVVGATAYAMGTFPVGGWLERSAVMLFNTYFLFSLFRAWRHMLRDKPHQERRWLLRAIVVLLGIATTRPVMGVFFATSPMTHLAPSQFFGIAFWIGFSINAIVIELLLRTGDRARRS